MYHITLCLLTVLLMYCILPGLLYYILLVLFDDEATGKKILASHSPMQMKSLGRKVTPFNPAVWSSKCQDIVAKGNYHKVRSVYSIISYTRRLF